MLINNQENIKNEIIKENLKVHKEESKIYDDFHIEIFNRYENHRINKDINYIKNLFEKNRMINLLDIGCGTGNIGLRFASDDRFRITAVDLSREMLEEFEKKVDAYKNIVLIRQSAEEFLNKNSKKYDVITIYSTLHHFYKPYSIFSKALNIINKQGIIYLSHEPLCKKQQQKNLFSEVINFLDRVLSNFYYIYKLKKIPKIDHTIADYHSKEGIDVDKLKKMLEYNFNILSCQEHSVNRMAITNLIDNKVVKTKKNFKLIAQRKN